MFWGKERGIVILAWAQCFVCFDDSHVLGICILSRAQCLHKFVVLTALALVFAKSRLADCLTSCAIRFRAQFVGL